MQQVSKGKGEVGLGQDEEETEGCWVEKAGGWVGQGSRISPDLLNRLPATVEEERGRKWISTAEPQRKT